MKSPIRGFLAVTLLSVSALASALSLPQPTVQLIWTGTTGNGTAGIDTITTKAGDELTLDILVNDDQVDESFGGLRSANFSLQWGAGLTGYNTVECPSPPNPSPGLCVDSIPRSFQPVFPGVTETIGLADEFDALSTLIGLGGLPVAGYFNEPMFLGRITYVVDTEVPNNTVSVLYDSSTGSVQGILSGGTTLWAYPEATATVIPPCSGCGCPP